MLYFHSAHDFCAAQKSMVCQKVLDEGSAVDIAHLDFTPLIAYVPHKERKDKLLKIRLNPWIVQWI